MKPINQKAKKIMDILTEGLDENNHYKKIENSKTYMAVHVDRLSENLFAVAHNFKQNGDVMADPDMTFYKGIDGNYYPASYQLDSIAIYQEAIVFEDGKIKGFRPALQKDLAIFAGTWMNNIKNQQEL